MLPGRGICPARGHKRCNRCSGGAWPSGPLTLRTRTRRRIEASVAQLTKLFVRARDEAADRAASRKFQNVVLPNGLDPRQSIARAHGDVVSGDWYPGSMMAMLDARLSVRHEGRIEVLRAGVGELVEHPGFGHLGIFLFAYGSPRSIGRRTRFGGRLQRHDHKAGRRPFAGRARRRRPRIAGRAASPASPPAPTPALVSRRRGRPEGCGRRAGPCSPR